MKKEITVVGIGRHMSGVSKKGVPYSLHEVAVTHADQNFVGRRCDLIVMNDDMFNFANFEVGKSYVVEMQWSNFKPVIAGIYG